MTPSDPELWPETPTAAPARPSRAAAWAQRLGAGLRTLKARLTLAAIGALVAGIGVISLVSLAQVEHDLLAQAQARELTQTARLAGELSQRAVALQQTLRSTANQIDPALEQRDDALEQHLQAQPALLQQFSNLFVASAAGQLRLVIDDAGPRRPRVSVADRDYFRRVLAEKRPIISDPVPGRISGEPVIVFAHPILRNGQVTSVIGGAIRLSSHSLAASLLDREAEPGSEELLVVSDEAGLSIAHPRRDLLLKPLSLEPRMAHALGDWTSRGSPAEPTGLLLDEPGEIVTAAGVAATGWIVWRAIPQSSLLEPLHHARWQALRNAAAVIAVLGLLTFWLVKRLLAPLGQLQVRAQHLFDTSRNIHEGWPDTGGEVAALTQVLRHVGAERAHLESFTNQLLGRLHSVMSAAPVGIGFTRNQRFELINRAWCGMLQREESELLGARAADIFSSDADYEQLGLAVAQAFATQGEYVGEWRFRRKDGSTLWAQLSGRPVNPQDVSAGTIWTFADVTASRASRESLEWTATHDPLTGLANRAAFESRLQAVLGHPPAALLFIDLDRFKPINDSHGHQVGDEMLKRVANALLAQVRAGDLVVRVGGDEFAVVLERCPADAAQRIAQDIQRAVARTELRWGDQVLGVGASVGVAVLVDAIDSVEAWVAAADSACYAAKAAGRGAVRMARTGTGGVGAGPGAGHGNVIELPRVGSGA